MPCNKVGAKHNHAWPTQAEGGDLVIERCEVLCGYCEGADAEHNWKFAWYILLTPHDLTQIPQGTH